MEVTKTPALGDERRESSKENYRPGHFDYQRLDAFRVARESLVRGQELIRRLPRGQRKLADQLWRALLGAYLQVAEGASRSGDDRLCRYRGARAEAAEAAAAVEAVGLLGLAPLPEAEQLTLLLGRLCAMLTRLSGVGR